MKTFILWGALALAPVGFVAPVQAQPNLISKPLKWPTIRPSDEANAREQGLLNDYRDSVRATQYLLRARGFYKGPADGVYGPMTIAAIKAFQRRNGLLADGILGPQTLPRLVIPTKRGSTGDAVRAAQCLAREAMDHDGGTPNEDLKVDGIFGKQTEDAVKTAQACLNNMETRVRENGVMDSRSYCLSWGGRVIGQD